MADSISCPHCRRLLEVSAEYRGRQVRCPECQGVFVSGPQTDITAQAPRAGSEVQPGLPRFPSANADDDDDVGDHRPIGPEFKPGGSLALAVKVLLGVNLLLSVMMLGGHYLQYDVASRLIARADVQNADIVGNHALQTILGFIHLALYLVSAILFLIWFHRVHANLIPLGAQQLAYSSGWAVGYWFVPFLNLVRPVQVAQEIWRNSDPYAIDGKEIRSETSANSIRIGFWWAMWLISSILSDISGRAAWSVTSPDSLRATSIAGMIAQAATIVAAALALSVVAGIDARQTARAEALQLMD